MTLETQIAIIGLVNAVTTAVAAALSKDNTVMPIVSPKWRAVIVAGLTIVTAGCSYVIDGQKSLQQAALLALTGGVGGLIVTLLAVITDARVATAKHMAAKAAAGFALVLTCGALAGCSWLQGVSKDVNAWTEKAQTFELDAQTKLAQLHSIVDAALAVMPDVPVDVRQKIELGFAAAQDALATAVNATGAVHDLTENDMAKSFGGFVQAYFTLTDLLKQFGVIGSDARIATGKLGAARVEVPMPAVVRYAQARDGGVR